MIGIVVVSHSQKVSEGICDMVEQISASGDHKLPIIAEAEMQRVSLVQIQSVF